MTFGSTAQTLRMHVLWGCAMMAERRQSALPTQEAPDHRGVRVAEALIIGAADIDLISATDTPRPVAASDESIATILVPLGDLDYFSVRHLTDAAAAHFAGSHRSVTLDLSAVSFCDSSIGSLFHWLGGLPDELDVTVVTGPAVEHVLDLITESSVRRPRVPTSPTDASSHTPR